MFKTFIPKVSTKMDRQWFLVDLKGQTLGRVATRIADALRGKNKPTFTPHMDQGDYVVVINAAQVHVTGNKEEDKEYIHHTGFWGHLRRSPLKTVRAKKPEQLIEDAVRGMMPRNLLRRAIMAKLFIYPGADHPHKGQNPKQLI